MVDIGASQEAIDLQATIHAAPDDAAPQLVLADLLLSVDDPRGELIVLDRREREGDLVDPDALERLLELAAVYGFPRAEPEDAPLPFASEVWGAGASYVLRRAGSVFRVQHRRGQVVLYVDDSLRGRWAIASPPDGWTATQRDAILRAIGDVIRENTRFKGLRIPFETVAPLPYHAGAAPRCYGVPRKFAVRRGVAPSQLGLAARDYRRWMALWTTCGRIRAARRDGDQL